MKKATLWILIFATGSAVAQSPLFLAEEGANELVQVDLSSMESWSTGRLPPVAFAFADLSWSDGLQSLWFLGETGEMGTFETYDARYTPRWNLGSGAWVGLAWSPIANHFQALRSDGRLFDVDATTGVTTPRFDFGAASAPYRGLTCEANGRLWLLDSDGSRLVFLDSSGTNPSSGSYGLSASMLGVALDRSSSELYLTRDNDTVLYRYDFGFRALLPQGSVLRAGNRTRAYAFATNNGSATRFGQGCDAGLGALPRLILRGVPRVGQRLSIEMENVFPGPRLFVRGISDRFWGPFALPMDLGFLGAPGCMMLNSHQIVLGPNLGELWVQTIPGDRPEFVGAWMYWQGYSLAPGVPNALGIAVTDSIHIVIGG